MLLEAYHLLLPIQEVDFAAGMVQDYREPLYLKDKAVYLPDTRSEEERKYPEFFRNKLKGRLCY